MEIYLYIIGFFVLAGLIGWIADKIKDLLETRRYKIKLNNLAPQLRLINISNLYSNLLKAKESYSSLLKLCQHRYMIDNESEQEKTISKYVQEEASYRRKKIKSSAKISETKFKAY